MHWLQLLKIKPGHANCQRECGASRIRTQYWLEPQALPPLWKCFTSFYLTYDLQIPLSILTQNLFHHKGFARSHTQPLFPPLWHRDVPDHSALATEMLPLQQGPAFLFWTYAMMAVWRVAFPGMEYASPCNPDIESPYPRWKVEDSVGFFFLFWRDIFAHPDCWVSENCFQHTRPLRLVEVCLWPSGTWILCQGPLYAHSCHSSVGSIFHVVSHCVILEDSRTILSPSPYYDISYYKRTQ